MYFLNSDMADNVLATYELVSKLLSSFVET